MQCMQWCPKPSYDQNQGLRGRQDSEISQLYGKIQSKTHPKKWISTQLEPNSLNKDVYGIEIEIRLQGQVRENEEGK